MFFYLSANNFIEVYTRFGKTWVEISFPYQDWIIAILKKRFFKKAVREVEGKSQIAVILRKYKNTLDNLMNSSYAEFLETSRFEDA